jgi:multidrug efflux pump subunit AcrA (membrane-fusion protein)
MLTTIKKHKLLTTIGLLALIAIVAFGVFMWLQGHSQAPAPQTATVTKTTLRQIVSASGQVDSSGQTSISTQAGGKVKKVYVAVGDTVKKGDKILEIDPDAATLKNQNDARAAYLMAKNNHNQATAKLYTLAAARAAAEQEFNQDAVDKGLSATDTLYIQLQNALKAAQAEYNNQQGVIDQAKAVADNAYAAYLQTSSTVTAITGGTIQDLAYHEGAYIASTSASAAGGGGGGSSVATLKVSSKLVANIKVSELDISGVKVGQEATLTLTALAGKTYHGRIISVGSSGTTESNVTTFPVAIEITDGGPEILVGMGVSADITVQVKENVLALPNQTITTTNGKHTVRVLKNGEEVVAEVSVGLVLDTQFEITAGLKEGDIVVVPSSSSSGGSSTNTSSTNSSISNGPAGPK